MAPWRSYTTTSPARSRAMSCGGSPALMTEIQDLVRAGLYTNGDRGITSHEGLISGDYAGLTYLGVIYNVYDTDNDLNTTGDRVPLLNEFDGVSLTVNAVVLLVWGALFGAYSAIAVAVTYHDLRVAKEGIDIERITAVFD